jgi:Sulfotransferase family
MIENDPRLLIFVHVPKAGGSTLRSIMQRNVLKEERLAANQPAAAMMDPELRLFSGHIRFGLHHGLLRPAQYVTMLREPLSRYISDYFFAFQSFDHRLRDEIRSGSLSLERVMTDGRYHDRLALIRQTTGLDRPAAEDADSAAEILEDSYTVVGLMERFDESVLLLAHVMGWSPPLYLQRNRTVMDAARRSERDAFQQNPHPVALQRFATDVAFYRAGERHLERSIELAGPSFPAALVAFRSLQAEVTDYIRYEPTEAIYTQSDFRKDDPLPTALRSLARSAEWRIVSAFIHSDTPLRRRVPPLLHGCIEHVQHGYISGWAVRYGRDEPVRLVVTCQDGRQAECVADIERPDLAGYGFDPAPRGFVCKLPSVASRASVKVLFDGRQSMMDPIRMEMLQD